MEYNEAKKTLEDLGIDPVEVGKTGEKIASEIIDKAKAMNQNESISHVSDTKLECPNCNGFKISEGYCTECNQPIW